MNEERLLVGWEVSDPSIQMLQDVPYESLPLSRILFSFFVAKNAKLFQAFLS
jgi:hypothetical protein